MRPPGPFSTHRIARDSNPLARRDEPPVRSSPRRVSSRVRNVLAHRSSLLTGHAGADLRDHPSRRPSASAAATRPAPIEPRRYVTTRVGGTLGGVVTLSETDGQEVRVQASWGERDSLESVSVTHASERDALLHANELVEALVAGQEPRQHLVG